MNKEQFLAVLRARLSRMPQADLERTLQYYREMIDDRIEDGMPEADAVADVGDPAELAAAILHLPAKQTALRTARRPAAQEKTGSMSAGKKAALIVCAILLIAAGAGLIVTSLNRSRWSVTEKEYMFAGVEISALELESGAADVELLHASDSICRVVCNEDSARNYKVWLNEGTLHVERVSRWSLFRVSLTEDYVRINLPEREYASLWIKSSSGGVSIPEGFRFRVASVSSSSGGIGFAADVTETLFLHASSGGIAVSGGSPSRMEVSASSGGIVLSSMTPGSIAVDLSSGALRLEAVRCGELSAESSSGSIRLSDVIAERKIALQCSSGSVRLDDCDASELRIKCSSGSVSGHLLTPKIYNASSSSGSVRVPKGNIGGICEIHTSSGSINFD